MNDTIINTVSVTEGMTLVSRMLKAGYVAAVAGKQQTIISSGITHNIRNGKPYWFTEDDRVKFQHAVRTIASEMLLQRMSAEPNTPEDDPWCGGADWIEKFRTLRRRVNIEYLFAIAGYSKVWYDNRLSRQTSVRGKFAAEDIESVNRALHTMALQLSALEFVPDEHSAD